MAKQITKWAAEDGTEFASEMECNLYENDKDAFALVGISCAQMSRLVDDAREHTEEDARVALCIERVGRKLARARQERGDKLRGNGGGEQ